MIKHSVTHYYQPTNHTCSQAAMAILLSFFDKYMTPEEVAKAVPVNKDNNGEEWGTINQQLATWCLSQGYEVEMHTADFEVIDLSWANLSRDKLLERMAAAKEKRVVPSLGNEWSEIYMQSYIDFVKSSGQLYIHPFMTTELIDSLLPDSPLLICVCYNVLHNAGRGKEVGLRNSEPDDIDGKLANHSVVIYGKDDTGNYLIAEPWKEPGRHVIEPERLLAAMAAAQMECDNLFLQLKPKVEVQ